jgi:hypothetical protein
MDMKKMPKEASRNISFIFPLLFFQFNFGIFIDIDELYSSEGSRSIGRLFGVVKGYDASNLCVLDTPSACPYTSREVFKFVLINIRLMNDDRRQDHEHT